MKTKQQHEQWMAEQHRLKRAWEDWRRERQYIYKGSFARS
jgi:hypothetical protein